MEYVSAYEYDLYIAADASGTQSAVFYSAWFYFGTDCFHENKTYVFNVMSTGKQVPSIQPRVSSSEKASSPSSEWCQAKRNGLGFQLSASTPPKTLET